jgi:hypothetical protein
MHQHRYHKWHLRIRIAAGSAMLCLLAAIAWEILKPIRPATPPARLPQSRPFNQPASRTQEAIDTWQKLVGRRRLFKPAIPLPARRMAGKTVAKVRDMIRLNAIMDRNGQRVAYIRIQDIGLQPFKVGDSLDELFAVTRIDPESVEVEIAGERIRLD